MSEDFLRSSAGGAQLSTDRTPKDLHVRTNTKPMDAHCELQIMVA